MPGKLRVVYEECELYFGIDVKSNAESRNRRFLHQEIGLRKANLHGAKRQLKGEAVPTVQTGFCRTRRW